MASNDRILLDNLLQQQKAAQAPNLTPDKYFEFFATDHILKDFDLSAEEIQAGIVDGGGDGGLDGVYVFVNGQLLAKDTNLSEFGKDPLMDLVFVQAKNEDGFSEDALNRLRSSSEKLLNLGLKLDSFKKTYNSSLLKIIKRFRDAYSTLAAKFPRISIAYYYAAKKALRRCMIS